MIDFSRAFRKKREEISLVLDIGSEAVKTLILQKKEGEITVLGGSLAYFKRYGIFDSRGWEGDILKKTILKGIEEINQKIRRKPERVFLGLSADILKGRIIFQTLKRKQQKKVINAIEEKVIYEEVLKEARKNISQTYSQDSGILAQDIAFTHLKILEMKIDGYEVSNLQGYEGENLDFKILTTFLPENYLKEIEGVIEKLGFKTRDIIHEVEGLTPFLKEIPDGIFLDIGGEITLIFLAKTGKMERISEFKIGGKTFSQTLSEKLGLSEAETRIIKERYSKGELSKESADRIREIFCFPRQTWFQSLKLKLKEIKNCGLFPSNIYLFGGGSQLPEIKEILETGDWDDFSFASPPSAEILYPKNLFRWQADETPSEIKIESIPKDLNSPQILPPFLVYHAWQ